MNKNYTLSVSTAKLNQILGQKREELPKLIETFQKTYVKFKVDKFGNETNITNPLLVSTYFFKPINPMNNVNALYTSDQLSLVYSLYGEIIEKINMEVMVYQPTLSHFARFIGVSLETLQDWSLFGDDKMRNLISRINSDIFDANMTLAQHERLVGAMTTYRMKVENDKNEKKTPNINVNVSAKSNAPLDLDKINDRIKEITLLSKKELGGVDYEDGRTGN